MITSDVWLHVNLYFEFEEQPGNNNLRIRTLLRQLRVAAGKDVQGYFYLYEPDPHCFLALNVREDQLMSILTRLKSVVMPNWVYRRSFTFPTLDGTNDPHALSVMATVAEGLIEGRLTRQKSQRAIGLTEFHHLIHCLMDMYYGSREEERECYHQMLMWYRPLSARPKQRPKR